MNGAPTCSSRDGDGPKDRPIARAGNTPDGVAASSNGAGIRRNGHRRISHGTRAVLHISKCRGMFQRSGFDSHHYR